MEKWCIMSFQVDYKMKPIYDFYEKLRFDRYECLFGLHHDIGYSDMHKFPVRDTYIDKKLFTSFMNRETTVAVISDTHNYENIDQVISYINEYDIEWLIHAGDIGSPYMLDKLAKFKGQIVGVLGNHDRQYAADFLMKMREINQKTPDKIVLGYDSLKTRILNHNFHVIHEHNDVIEPLMYELTTTHVYNDKTIVFGHIHRPMLFVKEREIVGNYEWTSPVILNSGICCRKDNITLDVESEPMFCLYNVKNPLWSVFVRI